jgi:hypothetical protein
MAKEVSRRPFNAEARGRFQASPCMVGIVARARVFTDDFGFRLSASFHQCSILIFIFMFVLREGQTDEVWESPEKQYCFGSRAESGGRVLLLGLCRVQDERQSLRAVCLLRAVYC